MTVINPKILRWFEGRGIDPETVARTGIYSGRRLSTGVVEPDPEGEIIVFPTVRNGSVVAEKYRAAHKTFWQKAGGLRSFYNADILSDPALRSGDVALIITEGEPDWLTALQCGFPHAVSVPDGAPPERLNAQDESLELPEHDTKFSYIMLDWDRLKLVKRIILAVDNDAPGKRLAEELVRRLGRIRCYWVEYPEGCKDLNDVLQTHGQSEVVKVLNSARPYPVNGLYALSEFPPEPAFDPRSTGWARLDEYIKVFYPCFMVVTGFAGAGKALALDTPIPIPSGWTTMGDLRVGDEVYDEQGRVCHVINVTPPMLGRPCYRIRFDDGVEIVADAEHQWLTATEKARNSQRNRRYRRNGRQTLLHGGNDQSHKQTHPSVITTEKISKSIILNNRHNHQIKRCSPICGADRDFVVHPYMLGAWLGDGTSSNGTITCFDFPILDYIKGLGYRLTKQKTPGRYNVTNLIYDLRELGLLNNKHVPPQYLRAPVELRLELLRGLMDTDGCCLTKGSCEFTTTNRRIAEAALDLILGLGMRAVLKEGAAKLRGHTIGPKYRISFTPNCVAFHLPRKFERQRISGSKKVGRMIVDCFPVESVPVRCIQVDSPSSLFLCSKSYIPTHNSTWTNQLVAQLAVAHGWHTAIASYEMRLDPYVTDTLRSVWLQKPKHEWTREDIENANVWIEENFMFISPSHDDERHDIEWLIERAEAAVIRHGIRVLVIDPWNEIEHARARGEHVTDYTGRAIQALKRFGRDFDCLVIVVAHPTKEGARKKPEDLSLYDVSDSAHFANKADLGVVMIRQEGLTRVLIRKVRVQPDTGKPGDSDLVYDQALRIFSQ